MWVTPHLPATVDRKQSTALSAPGLDIRGRLSFAGLPLLAASTGHFGTGANGRPGWRFSCLATSFKP
jgi:hypothetical protein